MRAYRPLVMRLRASVDNAVVHLDAVGLDSVPVLPKIVVETRTVENDNPIQKCERCGQLESLAEGFRLALIESAKLIEFILDPATTEAQRADLRQQAFGDLPADASMPPKPPAGCNVIEHGPGGDANCPDCRG
jgi:hypothetical protein